MITSRQNPLVKKVAALRQRSSRDESQLFLVEGAKEVAAALSAGYKPCHMLYAPELLSSQASMVLQSCDDCIAVNKSVYEKLAMRASTEGLLGVFEQRADFTLELPDLKAHDLVIILERIEKPGNLGAIMRSADALGARAVCLVDPLIDIYNPNAIRASLGTIFQVPLGVWGHQDFMSWAQQQNLELLLLSPHAEVLLEAQSSYGPIGLVFGSEAHGLSCQWPQQLPQRLLPMVGQADSLNLSVSVAIAGYEVRRSELLKG